MKPASAGMTQIARRLDDIAWEIDRLAQMSASTRMSILRMLDALENPGPGKSKRIKLLREFSNAADKLYEIIDQFKPKQAGS